MRSEPNAAANLNMEYLAGEYPSVEKVKDEEAVYKQ